MSAKYLKPNGAFLSSDGRKIKLTPIKQARMSLFKLADSLQKITIIRKGPYCKYQHLAGNYFFMANM